METHSPLDKQSAAVSSNLKLETSSVCKSDLTAEERRLAEWVVSLQDPLGGFLDAS